ncbi:MAG: hypothetical protein HY901_33320, partial [Deltaproteobacteria bacterium]|nr:hypothetical protein [Deltaproteobacteria bacterium]
LPDRLSHELLWLADGRLADLWREGPCTLLKVKILSPREAIVAWPLPAILTRLATHLGPGRPEALEVLLQQVARALEEGAEALRAAVGDNAPAP